MRTLLHLLIVLIYVIFPAGCEALGLEVEKIELKDRAITEFRLDNGLILIIEEDHRFPVVSIQTWLRGGSAQEEKYMGSGISHLIEHMLFKGTHSRDVGRIGKEIKELGGSIGGYTTLDRTVYTIALPSVSAFKGLEIIADVIRNSTFEPDEFERERDVVYKEINMTKDDPGKFLFRVLFEEAYSDHPYRFPVIGYQDRMQTLTSEEAYEFYKRMYVPNNLVLVVVGDVDTVKIKQKVEELYYDFHRGEPMEVVHVPERPRNASRIRRFEKDIAKARMIIGFMGPSIRDKDLYAVDAAASILGSGQTSRLYQRLKEDEQLVWGISSFSFTPREPGIIGISCTLDVANIEEVQEMILDEIEKLKNERISKHELDRVKVESMSSYIYHMETVSGRAGHLGYNEVMVGDVDFSTKYLEGIRRVNAVDVQAAVQKYMTEPNMTIVILYPKGTKPFAKINEEDRIANVTQIVLDNGVRLVVEEDSSLPIVSINTVFFGRLTHRR